MSAGLVPLPPREQRDLWPRILPPGWRRYTHSGDVWWDSLLYRVLMDAARETDGRRWLHLSLSRRDGVMPTWGELLMARDAFVGPEAYAVQILAPRSEHYDAGLGVDVAHLWVCLDGRPLPDFRAARGGAL